MPFQDQAKREAITRRSRKARERGQVERRSAAVAPPEPGAWVGTRDNARFVDQSGQSLIFETTWGSNWGS